MKTQLSYFLISICILFSSCTKDGGIGSTDSMSSGVAPTGTGAAPPPAGVITAGEWNDLESWKFWDSLMSQPEFSIFQRTWQIYNKDRIAVHITGVNGLPAGDIGMVLKRNGTSIYHAKTDNRGNAELWPNLFDSSSVNFSQLKIEIINSPISINAVKPYSAGVNYLSVTAPAPANKMQIAFVVDATGSMGDELVYLQREVLDVITRSKMSNPSLSLSTASVFYRDIGDEYVTKISNFTTDASVTTNFIKAQSASGGGDFPEAVDEALTKSINNLTWETNAKTKIMFLILDAPSHKAQSNINSLQQSILKAAEKGIKIITISASGIDKETEFLLRFLALSTNGTYVFITNDSGVGNNHIAATVGSYQVEFLNNLMVRLINKYSQ